jgi:biopolymer transport protein ExbD/biopolymer transport protein TolR
MASSGKNATFSDINITPLTDVFLVLLVVIIIAAPVTNQQREIKAPVMSQSMMIDEKWPLIEIKSTGEFFSDGKAILENGLEPYLTTLLPATEPKNLVIRGDKATQSGKVMLVMEAAQNVGYQNVFISGELARDPAGAASSTPAAAPAPATAPAQ